MIYGKRPSHLNVHYLPSTEKFLDYIAGGVVYGILMDIQSKELIEKGALIPLFGNRLLKVPLYWHCWNFSSDVMQRFTRNLKRGAKQHLGENL